MLRFLLPLYVVLWLILAGMHYAYKRRLRAVAPELAAQLYPGIFRKSAGSDHSGVRFLLGRQYRRIHDQSFVRFCEVYRGLVLVWFVVFAATILAVGTL
jgi:hypothetical protein